MKVFSVKGFPQLGGAMAMVCLLGACSFTVEKEKEFSKIPDNLKINEIQVLGTHNSYARPVDPKLLAAGAPVIDKMMEAYLGSKSAQELEAMKEFHPNEMSFQEGLNYDHPSFPEQLDAGLRNLAIDIYYDPDGGRFSDPAGYRVLKEKGVTDLAPFKKEGLETPGFKVMHVSDFDFRSHYPTLEGALKALKDWSNENPDHITIYVMIEVKDMGIPIFPNSAQVEPFTAETYDLLDAEVLKIMGREKIITPDDVRGKYSTLREAVLAKNWPTVNSARGKFIFLMMPTTAGLKDGSPYTLNHSNLENRVMFVKSQPQDDYAAFILKDNAIIRHEQIQELVKQGYMVRTRSDIETYEAKVNDHTRAEAAFSSGAQVVSTDFYKPGNAYGTDYYVQLPGGDVARCNPVNASGKCEDKDLLIP